MCEKGWKVSISPMIDLLLSSHVCYVFHANESACDSWANKMLT